MERFDSLPGTVGLRPDDMEFFLMQYVKARGLLKNDSLQTEGNIELFYRSNEQLWFDIISQREIYELRRIILEDFVIMEWLPQSPGLYHTEAAKRLRRDAQNFIIKRSRDFEIYDPYGKAHMVKGGVGCLRLSMKTVGGSELKFLCATKSGVAHEGFIIAVPRHVYSGVAPLIQRYGGVVADVIGEIRYWKANENVPFHLTMEVPRIYLFVDDLRIKSNVTRFGALDVTAAVTFNGHVFGNEGTYYTYAHFDPAQKEDLTECVNWIRYNYVQQLYSGNVRTDFDELISHFPDAFFPLKVLMDPNTTRNQMNNLVSNVFDLYNTVNLSIFIDNFVEGDVMNFSIKGDGNVVGNNNQVVTTIHKGLMAHDLRELGEAFALFKAEITQLNSIEEKTKNRALRAVQDAEEEAADKEPNKDTIIDGLNRAKQILEKSGDLYDKTKSWGKRLFELGKIMAKFIPGVGNLLPF